MTSIDDTTCSMGRRVALYAVCIVAGAAIGAAVGIGIAEVSCRRIERQR